MVIEVRSGREFTIELVLLEDLGSSPNFTSNIKHI